MVVVVVVSRMVVVVSRMVVSCGGLRATGRKGR
jgi:hypothetical protein